MAVILEHTALVGQEDKKAALEAVLNSATFARAEQLRRFLRYVSEMEMAGRGEEINEYLIGVAALGRPAGYSPSEDPVVRNRAYALRQKLEEYYSREAPNARIRIELPKGSYCPRFVEPDATPASVPPVPAAPRQWVRPFVMGAVFAGAAVAGLFLAFGSSQTPGPAGVLREAWGPLLTPGADVLVCVGTPAHFVIRTEPTAPQLESRNVFAVPPEVREWYATRHAIPADGKLFMFPTHNSPLWGDAIGSQTVGRVLASAGVSHQVLPERVVSYSSLRARNVLLFGSADYSPLAMRLLEKAYYRIEYDSAAREWSIGWREDGVHHTFGPKRRYREAVEVYGIITVLPSEGTPDRKARMAIFSGVTSAGTQAAAEFFASPASMEILRERFRADGRAGFPDAWQAIVEATSDKTLAMTVRYKAHKAL